MIGVLVALAASSGAAPLTFATEREREYFSMVLRCEGQLDEARAAAAGAEKACAVKLGGEREKVRTATVICAPVCPPCECNSGWVCGAIGAASVVGASLVCASACDNGPDLILR